MIFFNVGHVIAPTVNEEQGMTIRHTRHRPVDPVDTHGTWDTLSARVAHISRHPLITLRLL